MSSGKHKSALNEVIQNWLSNCMDAADPPSKTPEDLQSDAATFFRYISKNTQVVTESKLVLQTKSSHEEALVQLVQDLGPAFTQESHRSRLRALFVLAGAIGGCHETQLTNKVVKLLGHFLLSHCGPVDDDDYTEDYDTMIRDIAIQALASLVSIGGACSSRPESDEELADAITNRMDFAKLGITRRCAVPDADDTPDAYGFGSANTNDVRGGLSMLPRSKRAMCFDLLLQSLAGISPISARIPFKDELVYSNLQIQMVDFARFNTRCLQGESDPRCLLQLLKLLHSMQTALSPWFTVSFVSAEAVFPTEDIFDAVAPYFPIQFTPPPSDIHGITRDGLHQALLAVLTFTKVDAGVLKFNHQPMVTLSADLFMETLLPAPGDDNPGPLDKLEALECLSALLLPTTDSTVLELMDTRIAASLSQALRATHDEASMGVSQGGQMGHESKRLADYCRSFISKLAFQVECCSRKELWDIVVQTTVHTLSSQIKNSPSANKTSIAYLACLASSGGPRTLRACCTMGLQPLLDNLEERMADDEDTAAAVHGVGAFCSSCQVAMARASDQGVVLHPHALDSFSEGIAALFIKAYNREDLSVSIKIGAVRGIECLLIAGGIDQLSVDTMQHMCHFLDKLSDDVMRHVLDRSDLVNAYASVLGNIVGGVLNKENDRRPESLLMNSVLYEYVTKSVYPALLPSPEPGATLNFSGLHVLAIASASSTDVADPIMTSCLEMLERSVNENGIHADHPSARAVNYLLRNGGAMSIRAFHKSSSVDSIFASLNSFTQDQNSRTEAAFQTDLEAVNKVARQMLPAFRCCVPMAKLQQLLKMVSDILPPLSQSDNFRICLWLPFLAAALHAAPNDDKHESSIALDNEAPTLVKALTEVLSSTEFDENTRSAAGACLYAVVGLSKTLQACPVEPIISSSIAPTISATVDAHVAQLSFKLLACCGSAAANRGGSSSSTADEVAKFLVEVACKGKAQFPFYPGDENLFNAAVFENEEMILLSAASAYGSMLAVSTLKPLMRQRLMHACSKHIKAAFDAERDQALNSESITAPPAGLLAVVSYFICISDFQKLDRTTLHQISTLVVEGLNSSIFLSESRASTSSKNLVLTAALKVIFVAPAVVHGFALSIVTGLLRAYAVSDSTLEVSCKLLALQGLEGVAHMEGTSKSSTSSIKPAVVAVLAAAMNHPSGLLRQAAVDVRNAWYVVD